MRTVVQFLKQLEPGTRVTVRTKSGRSISGFLDDNHEADGVTLVRGGTDEALDDDPRSYILSSEIEGFDW